MISHPEPGAWSPEPAWATLADLMSFDFDALFGARPVLLAPMEDVSDAVFRRLCRARGAELCVTEFVHAPSLVEHQLEALRKIELAADDTPTAIQIYGADAAQLAAAAELAERARPAFIDVNCGCWVPKVARAGAGAGWLRVPDAMVEMVSMIVRRVSLPVTVKMRIGWGDEARMPVVDLARRLEDAGVRAITIHCRTAKMGHEGDADWSWAARARETVKIPVIVNGDIRTANDCHRALERTGCAGVMIGRRAIQHPWIFREARARLDHRPQLAAPSIGERFGICREHLRAMAEDRGPRQAVRAMRRFYPGYLRQVPDAAPWIEELQACESVEVALALLDEGEGASFSSCRLKRSQASSSLSRGVNTT
ncbi:MAG TPA: tRNA-dihydrouridine synthase [Polyangiales bacterium]|nr:tRNA-dihydrouridine synthase [Polyangiales bacterium]